MTKLTKPLTLLLISQLLVSCITPPAVDNDQPQEEVVSSTKLEQNQQTFTPAESSYSISINRARILADILFAAKNAFDDNNLLLPAGDNAYDRYLEVLSVDPDNGVALEGLEEIVERYLELANEAISTGRYNDADIMLERATSINGESNVITNARLALQQARLIQVDMFDLDPERLSLQNMEMVAMLSDIGQYIKDQGATFLITARTDAEGRWIYRIMRESVDGYRLRGDITLGGEPRIQVNIPKV